MDDGGSMWVVHPRDQYRLREAPDIAAKLQNEIAVIESLGDEAACRLCSVRTSLTKEHTPAKKAGNPSGGVRMAIDYVKSIAAGRVLWMTHKFTGGITVETLCKSCNNNTGAWYNPAYIRFARHCQQLARKENAGAVCDVDLEVHPQRVLKQALTSIIATSQPGLTARYPDLRKFLTLKEAQWPITPVRVWLFLMANRTTRKTGLVVRVSLDGVGLILAEFSSWPLGWVAGFGDVPIDGAVEVSEWSNVDFHGKVRVTLKIPCQWVLGPYPADFRAPAAFQGREHPPDR